MASKSQKNRRMLGTAPGLLLAAAVVDRLFLGVSGPAELSAASPPASASSAEPPSFSTLRTPAIEVEGRSPRVLAERLDRYAAGSSAADGRGGEIFAAVPAWAPVAPESEPTEVEVSAGESFRDAHELSAVLIGGAKPIAILDGRLRLEIGDGLEGFTLISIEEGRAAFRSGLHEVELVVAEGSAGR